LASTWSVPSFPRVTSSLTNGSRTFVNFRSDERNSATGKMATTTMGIVTTDSGSS